MLKIADNSCEELKLVSRMVVEGGRKKTPRDPRWLQMRCALTKSAAGEMQVDLAFVFIRVNILVFVDGWNGRR